MLKDPVSNPIKWLMLLSAICLIIFLYKFTADSLSYLDYMDRQTVSADEISASRTTKTRENKALHKLTSDQTDIAEQN